MCRQSRREESHHWERQATVARLSQRGYAYKNLHSQATDMAEGAAQQATTPRDHQGTLTRPTQAGGSRPGISLCLG